MNECSLSPPEPVDAASAFWRRCEVRQAAHEVCISASFRVRRGRVALDRLASSMLSAQL